MKTLTSILLLGLLMPLLSLAQPPAPTGPYVIADYLNLKGETEYEMMTMNEFNERNKIVRAEKSLYVRALKAASAEWQNGENTLRFPYGAFSPPEVRRIGVYPREKDANKKYVALQRKLEEQQSIRDRSEKAKEDARKKKKYGGAGGRTPEEFNAGMAEAREEAHTLLREKLDEMLGIGDSAQSRTMRPEDVLNGGRK